MFTPSVFGEVSLVSVAAASGAAAAAAAASTGSVAQAGDSAAAEDSAASGPAVPAAGGRVEEFTVAERAQHGKGPGAAPAVVALADAEQPAEEQAPPPTELELR